MSPEIVGVNALPERNDPFRFTCTALKKLYRRLYVIWCGPWAERAHSMPNGLPAVLWKPETYSRTYEYV